MEEFRSDRSASITDRSLLMVENCVVMGYFYSSFLFFPFFYFFAFLFLFSLIEMIRTMKPCEAPTAVIQLRSFNCVMIRRLCQFQDQITQNNITR